MNLPAAVHKATLRRRLERDATLTAVKLAKQAPAPDRRRLLKHLKRLRLVLLRIRSRDYGVCAACGKPIGDARLRLMPTAGTCAACQKKIDAEPRTERR